jgi:hypothetical protein
MALTLNQLVKQITTFGNNHKQIKFVYFGDVLKRLNNGEVTYPAMFFTLNEAQILAKQIQYNFSIYVMDRMLMEEINETEVLSDMTLVGQDLVANLRSPEYNWIASDNMPITFYTEDRPDYLAGVKIDFSLTLSSLNDTCQIPTNG